MCIVLLMALMKTFFFLRVSMTLAYLVTLIIKVMGDLVFFIMFYIILIYMFGLILGVLGYENFTFMEVDDPDEWEEVTGDEEAPGFEYEFVPTFVGNIFAVIRMSLGDNDFGGVIYLGNSKGMVFWITWAIIAYICFIIFMNFIITEACVIYEKVADNLEQNLLLERANLINEA